MAMNLAIEQVPSIFCCNKAGIVTNYTFCHRQKQISDLAQQTGGQQVSRSSNQYPASFIWA
jgi:hypothetical protein